MYNELKIYLEDKDIPKYVTKEINNFISFGREYIYYREQYITLKNIQSVLDKYYDSKRDEIEKENFYIWDKYFLKLLLDFYKSKYGGTEYQFLNYYVNNPKTILKDLYDSIGNSNLEVIKENLTFYYIKDIADKLNNRAEEFRFSNLNLDSLENSIYYLKYKKYIKDISIDESYKKMFSERFHKYLISQIESKNYGGLILTISHMRILFIEGDMKNRSSDYFIFNKNSCNNQNDNFSNNLNELKEKINIILNKYNQEIINNFESQKHEVDKLRELLNL
ncbi:hypothetical protein PMY56_03605 [Clostridium tertium]|uniref:hypothetical protein n=1 Tax=Clostridium tertium TaxID=1559 RepID=UPI00232D06DD|nr:hypothetical protein [Clostridium tertium]MDB1921087.1 hypothetical protein [Clostridium tertium]MDB1925215.1 hypothetical protein [Clostridium tertium]MDB1930301.1 hypothetical protein [Clostridium tertium]